MSDPVPVPHDQSRLNGWKEIASHLGKGVRTAQRWEKLYGLPVHRIGEGGGEIVFAFRQEIEDWLRTVERARLSHAPDDQPSPGGNGHARVTPVAPGANGHAVRDHEAAPADASAPGDWRATSSKPLAWRRMAVAASLLTSVAMMAIAWLATSDTVTQGASSVAATARQPASYRFLDQAILVFDEKGAEMWRHPLEAQLPSDWQPPATPGWSGPVAIVDLDGDGAREVLFSVVHSPGRRGQALMCFNADGSLRWARLPDDRHRFGETEYTAPWLSHRFLVTRNADGTRTVWATFIHGLLFPTVLEQIDASGVVRSRYWSNGYVDSLSESTWHGRPVLLVGAANNEHKGTSLAILDRAVPSGRAPAVNPKYRCETCPPGDPLAFVVFPPSPVGLVRGDTLAPDEAWVDEAGRLTVNLQERVHDLDARGGLYYTLDGQLRPVRVEVSVTYEQLHDQLHKQGRIDRPYSPAEEQRMVPILRWDGSRFVEEPLAR